MDDAVLAAYGWNVDISEDEILAGLLELNLARSEDEHVHIATEQETTANAEHWRDAVGIYLVHHLHQDPHFGRTKLQKLLYLAEVTYQLPLEGEYVREAAGPLDTDLIYPLEKRAHFHQWFKTQNWQSGAISGVHYVPDVEFDAALTEAQKTLGEKTKELDKLIEIFGRCNTETAEKIATLYAVWNDLLLDGKEPNESAILDEVLNNWHPQKQRIPRVIWRSQLDWMKQNDFYPQGLGRKTSPRSGEKYTSH